MRVFGGILLLAAAVFARDPVVVCASVDEPLRIDGSLSEEAWKRARAVTIDGLERIHPKYRETWTGSEDLSARLRALIDGRDLVLGIEITDDRRLHVAGRAWWAGDSIEVFLDTDLTSEEPGNTYTDDDYQLFLLPFHNALRWGVVSRGPGVPYPHGGLSSIEVAHSETPTGYVVEARIPLSVFPRLSPKDGRIGFDIALNDVDDPKSLQSETYMTLSGRFELYNTPDNFGRLEVGDLAAPPATTVASSTDPTGILVGLGGLVLVGAFVLRFRRALMAPSRRRAAILVGAFAAGAALIAFLPALVAAIDRNAARARHAETIDRALAAGRAYLDLDEEEPARQAERLVALYRHGRADARPQYRFTCVPLTARTGRIRYGIELAPGEERIFPLEGLTAPERLRLEFEQPEPDAREAASLPAAVAEVHFAGHEPLAGTAPRAALSTVLLDCGARAGAPMRELRVRNDLSFQPLVLNAILGRAGDGAWHALPLATRTSRGIPFDIGRDRPQEFLVRIPPDEEHVVEPAGLSAHRLWIAIGASGAYPDSPFGEPAAEIEIAYRDGGTPAKRTVLNGRDVQDDRMAFARRDRSRIAKAWDNPGDPRLPRHYALIDVPLDPARTVASITVRDLGVARQLRIAAMTAGLRDTAPPPATSGLILRGDTVQVRDEARLGWDGLGFTVRPAQGAARSTRAVDGPRVIEDLGSDFSLEVSMPRGSLAAALLRARGAFYSVALVLGALAAVVAGAGALQRARRLRVKMLVALVAATAAPLLLLFLLLTTQLTEQAEAMLEQATRADLRATLDRISGAKARARGMASLARDRLELGRQRGGNALLQRSRDEIETQQGFLRAPGLDPSGPSALGNTTFVDSLARSGLYYSPWDGLLAVGVARASEQRRYFVGLRAAALLGEGGAPAVLYAPAGVPLWSRGTPPHGPRPGLRAALEREPDAIYAAHDGGAASAHALLRDGDRVVGMLGVFRSRAATDERRAAILRTLVLAGAAALLLVALAGTTLAERVTERLGRVTRAARALAQGDLSRRVPIEAADEVSRLAASFNRMADSLDIRVKQLTELHAGLQDLAGALDRRAVANAAAELLARTTGATHVTVATVDAGTERMETLAKLGDGAPMGARLPDAGPVRDAVRDQRPVQGGGAAFLPLIAAGRIVGVAACSPLNEEIDTDFLDLAGRQIGMALENTRLYRAAVTDELTGLYTHTFFARRLREEVDRAHATDRPLSLLRVLVEDFGGITRTQGVAAAARLVVDAAATIGEVLPPRNMVARREAGELLVLLVEADEDEAQRKRDTVASALQRKLDARFTFRSVTYPRDGEAADILLNALFEVAESWEHAGDDTGPPLRIPSDLGVLPGRSPTMRAVLDVVARVAPTNATVLVSGETGAGKEVLADLIQANSDRHDRAYVKVNCAAIPETLIETELFGHEKGAFTGADRRRIGLFEEAHGGTLFLDEIGELPLALQAKLLRVLQERRFTRVGGTRAVQADVRILAASNRDLGEAVRQGQFREDLYHRLHVIEVRVPPLRERREEIAPLIGMFIERFNREHGLAVVSVSPDALDALYNHAWPGNVRELKNVVERAMVMANGPRVEREQIEIADDKPAAAPRVDGLTPRQERILQSALSKGGTTNADVVQAEEVSARTALRELQKLVERGLLVRVGRRRGAVYRPPE
ncbi:MAG: sigma 54-interacting transcriptional regulator [Planctomycetota bacterium]|jgi:DNA-binding NtrC family response regulator/HAMP domain-containing protein